MNYVAVTFLTLKLSEAGPGGFDGPTTANTHLSQLILF